MATVGFICGGAQGGAITRNLLGASGILNGFDSNQTAAGAVVVQGGDGTHVPAECRHHGEPANR